MSSPISAPHPRIHVYGHVSAQPAAIAKEFGAQVSATPQSESDLAIFAINPAAGIDGPTIALWDDLNETQVPRLVVVIGLEGQESDFEDAVMVANRVFDQMLTPFLALHGDDGEVAALISMKDLTITDYSMKPPTNRPCDPEHVELVKEFRDEYLAEMEIQGEGGFEAGLLFPAIPLLLSRGIGVDIVKNYIEKIANS